MRTERRRSLAAAVAVTAALAAGVTSAQPARAHSGGRVELFVDRIELQSHGGDAWTVAVGLIDADSGSPQPGFDVTVEAAGASGGSTGPVLLRDEGGGRYAGPLSARPGGSELVVRAESLPGGVAGIPLRKAYAVTLEPGRDVTLAGLAPAAGGGGRAVALGLLSVIAGAAFLLLFSRRQRARRARRPHGAVLAVGVALALAGPVGGGGPLTRPAGAQTGRDLDVTVERVERPARSALWVPVRVTVQEPGTDRPPAVDHVVFVTARNGRGDQAGPFELGTLELDDPNGKGVHEGFVILSYGGPWTVTAIVNEADADPRAAPVVLGRGAADLVVDAPVPASGPSAAAAGSGAESDPLPVAVLWLHTLAAIAWGAGIALLALLAVPAGRRFLSEYGTTLLDGRLDRIARATWWLTGLVVASGVYNLVYSVPYRVPLSPDQVERLFRLPYAQPYYLALAAKLAAYAVMVGAAVPLLREARRRAARAGEGPDEPELVLDDGPSPWANPEPVVSPFGGVALRRRTRAAVPARLRPSERVERSASGPVWIMVAGAAAIMTAVTLLKYLHLLAEVTRLTG